MIAIRSSNRTLATWLVVLFCVVLGTTVESHDDDPASFYFFLRPRLGHFSRMEDYRDVFKEYNDAVVKKNDKAMETIDINDWRNVRPTGELCLEFLQGFLVRDYQLPKPFDIVPLDACLDWAFDESDEKDLDLKRMSSASKAETKSFKKDKKLREIYESTKFKNGESIPQKLKDDLHAYFSRLLKINSDNPRNGCHSLWLEAYNDFVEDVYIGDDENNDDFYGMPESDKDSYLNLIIESTKAASRICYGVLQKQMPGLMKAAYEAEATKGTIGAKILSATNKLAGQSKKNKWNQDMVRILQLVSNTKPNSPVDIVQVVNDLAGIKHNDPTATKQFTDALSNYAMNNVDFEKSAGDPNGRGRYGRAMTKLCQSYTDPSEFLTQTGGAFIEEDKDVVRKPFEFYHMVYSLVRMTNNYEVFDISKDQFETDVMSNNWESLYMATFACKIISISYGELDYDSNTETYKVAIRPNARMRIEEWPIEVMVEKVPEKEGVAPLSPETKHSPKESHKFGHKFMFWGRHSPGTPDAEHADLEEFRDRAPDSKRKQKAKKLKKVDSQRYDEEVNSEATIEPTPKREPVSAPKPKPEPEPQPIPEPIMSKPKDDKPFIPELETIEKWFKLHGRMMSSLPPNIYDIYPSLRDLIKKKFNPKTLEEIVDEPVRRYYQSQPEPEPVKETKPDNRREMLLF